MELAELKKEIYHSIDELEDENILLEIIDLLKMITEDGATGLSYESSPYFIEKINEAGRQIEKGEGYSHEEAMNFINNRLWRTK